MKEEVLPGETDRQFQATLDLIERVRYDGLFAFMYSDRPLAPAAAFSGKLDETVKKARLQAVLDLQARITSEKHQSMIGQTLEVLVEGPGRGLAIEGTSTDAPAIRWTGRSSSNHIIHFEAPESSASQKQLLTGAFANIMIEGAHAHSLWGRLLQGPLDGLTGKGEGTLAA